MQNYLYRWHVLGRKSVVRLDQEGSFRLKEEIAHLISACLLISVNLIPVKNQVTKEHCVKGYIAFLKLILTACIFS